MVPVRSLHFAQQPADQFIDFGMKLIQRSIIDKSDIGQLFHFDHVLRRGVARGFPVFQFDELVERYRVVLPGSHQVSLEADFDWRFHPDQTKMLGIPEGCNLRGIANGIEDVILVVIELSDDAFGQNRRPKAMPEFIAHLNQQFARYRQSTRSHFIPNRVGERMEIKTFGLKVSRDFTFTCRVSAG